MAATDHVPLPHAVDPYWLYRNSRPEGEAQHVTWSRPYWTDIWHKLDVAGGTNDSVIRHALEPMLRHLGPTITTFHGVGNTPASSAAHDLMNLWLGSALGFPRDELGQAYDRCLLLIQQWPTTDGHTRRQLLLIGLTCLAVDADWLPLSTVKAFLHEAERGDDHDGRIRTLSHQCAQATQPTATLDGGQTR